MLTPVHHANLALTQRDDTLVQNDHAIFHHQWIFSLAHIFATHSDFVCFGQSVHAWNGDRKF